MEVGGKGDYMPIATLSPPDSHIKMGSVVLVVCVCVCVCVRERERERGRVRVCV